MSAVRGAATRRKSTVIPQKSARRRLLRTSKGSTDGGSVVRFSWIVREIVGRAAPARAVGDIAHSFTSV